MSVTEAVPAQRPSAELPSPKCPPALSSRIWQLRFLSICAITPVHIPSGRPGVDGQGLAWSILRFLELAVPSGFARIALPFFFCASGYFFFLKASGPVSAWYWPQLRKRLKSLAVPYLLWAAACTLITEAARFAPWARDLIRHGSHYSAAVWLQRIVFNPVPLPLWSIRELLLYAAAAP